MKDGILHIKSGQQYGTATQIPTEEAEIAAKKVAALFQRREAEEVRAGAGLRHHQGERRQVRRGLLVLRRRCRFSPSKG